MVAEEKFVYIYMKNVAEAHWHPLSDVREPHPLHASQKSELNCITVVAAAAIAVPPEARDCPSVNDLGAVGCRTEASHRHPPRPTHSNHRRFRQSIRSNEMRRHLEAGTGQGDRPGEKYRPHTRHRAPTGNVSRAGKGRAAIAGGSSRGR
jgi:hypothetical protein